MRPGSSFSPTPIWPAPPGFVCIFQNVGPSFGIHAEEGCAGNGRHQKKTNKIPGACPTNNLSRPLLGSKNSNMLRIGGRLNKTNSLPRAPVPRLLALYPRTGCRNHNNVVFLPFEHTCSTCGFTLRHYQLPVIATLIWGRHSSPLSPVFPFSPGPPPPQISALQQKTN